MLALANVALANLAFANVALANLAAANLALANLAGRLGGRLGDPGGEVDWRNRGGPPSGARTLR